MKQNKTLIFAASALMIAATFVATPKVNADGLAPGEGYYAGAFLGMGMGILQAKSSGIGTTGSDRPEGNTLLNYETDRGGLGLSGLQGGAWLGWGTKTADDIYFGAEMTFLGSDEKIKLTTNAIKAETETESSSQVVTEISAQRTWTGGGALRVGYYVNADTLFSVKAGIAASQFDVDIGSSSETYWAGGPQYGASIETKLSKVDPNLSLRIEGVVTDYLTADILGQAGVGRATGSISDYKYSKALLAYAAEAGTWNEENLDGWLKKPKDVVRKTKMIFAGLKKAEERANLIAFLKENGK